MTSTIDVGACAGWRRSGCGFSASRYLPRHGTPTCEMPQQRFDMAAAACPRRSLGGWGVCELLLSVELAPACLLRVKASS